MKHTQSKIKLGKPQKVYYLEVGDYFMFAPRSDGLHGLNCRCIGKIIKETNPREMDSNCFYQRMRCKSYITISTCRCNNTLRDILFHTAHGDTQVRPIWYM